MVSNKNSYFTMARRACYA